MGKRIQNLLKKMKKSNTVISAAIIFTVLSTTKAYAGGTPVLVSGTVKLLEAASGWLLLLIPVGAGLFLGYHALVKSWSEDQAVIAEKNKLMKNVLVGSAIATTAMGFAKLVLGYYS